MQAGPLTLALLIVIALELMFINMKLSRLLEK